MMIFLMFKVKPKTQIKIQIKKQVMQNQNHSVLLAYMYYIISE